MNLKQAFIVIGIVMIFLCGCAEVQEMEETITSETLVQETTEMTVTELQQYYDTSQYAGTPSYEKCLVTFQVDGKTGEKKARILRGSDYIEIAYTENLKSEQYYNCIICDNNTPDNPSDDVVAYVFDTTDEIN